MTETEVAFAPTKLGAHRRRLPPVLVGLAIVVLLAVAVAKPWPNGSEPVASPGASTAARVAAASQPLPGLATGDPGLSGVSSIPAMFPGPPRPGAWGISVGVGAPGDSAGRWASWTAWFPLDPVSERPEPPIRDPLPMRMDCTTVPTLDAAASILGITVPEGSTTNFSVLGWLYNGIWTEPLDGELARLDEPGRGQVASLARRDGLTFPDGRYELHLLTPDHVTALGFCLDSSGVPQPVAAGLEQEVTNRIVGDLAPRSGAWGVGNGGNGTRLLGKGPWTDWVGVDPGVSWDGTSLTLWPDTGLCMSAPRLAGDPSLIAITVPSALVPDWRVVGWWTDGSDTARLDAVVRQISPPGNRGISYLERVDRTLWPHGRYEFDVQAGDHRASLTVCIGAR